MQLATLRRFERPPHERYIGKWDYGIRRPGICSPDLGQGEGTPRTSLPPSRPPPPGGGELEQVRHELPDEVVPTVTGGLKVPPQWRFENGFSSAFGFSS